MLIGHAGNITCLAFSSDGSKIISGGWDSQVFVWDVEEGNVTAELTGHGGPVWGVMVYDEKLVITACADKMIRIFDINGKSLKTIQGHTDVVRCFCKIPSGHWSGAAFASAGNDEVIRLWTLDGQAIGEMHGHEAYIYSMAILPNGDIVSSSEDRTVRVWRHGECIQTITHPAISLWAVAACPETGDIVSGASDNIIRIFSRDPERQADTEVGQTADDLVDTKADRLARLFVILTNGIACTPYQPRQQARVNHFKKRICPVQVRSRSPFLCASHAHKMCNNVRLHFELQSASAGPELSASTRQQSHANTG